MIQTNFAFDHTPRSLFAPNDYLSQLTFLYYLSLLRLFVSEILIKNFYVIITTISLQVIIVDKLATFVVKFINLNFQFLQLHFSLLHL